MTPQDIPAGEQLMGLSSEPRVQANMQFLLKGLIWPTPEAIDKETDKAAQSNADLLDDTIGWIDQVLRPELIAPDLRSRLRAARAAVSGQDAFLTRYVINEKKVQIVVTRFHVHVVIAPIHASPLIALHQCLKVDRPDDPSPWSGDPWQTGQVGDLTYGYQLRGSVADWRDSIFYLTNGGAVKFSLEKIARQSRGSGEAKGFIATTEEAEAHWF